MAIEEARKIRETVSSSGTPAQPDAPPIPSPGTEPSDSDINKGAGYGTTLSG
jgi:hypothetical protein